jgi:hypothetical protein
MENPFTTMIVAKTNKIIFATIFLGFLILKNSSSSSSDLTRE